MLKDDYRDIIAYKLRSGQLSRRGLIKSLTAIGLGAGVLRGGMASAQAGELILATWGGEVGKATVDIFGGKLTELTGITVREDGSGPTEGAVQAQAASGKIAWDVMQLEYNSAITLGEKGLLGEIDYAIVDKAKIVGGTAFEYGVAALFNTMVLCYDSEKYGDNPPKTWKDFFDVEAFPGQRCIPKYMNGLLEGALLADGMAPDQLYPIDLNRALNKIAELLPHVSSVWGSGAESQQVMMDGDASMGMIWGTRAILVDRETEQRVTFTFNDGVIFPDAWSYMKDGPAGAEASNRFIAAAQDPVLQVELLKLVGLSPANPEAAALVPEEFKRIDCTQPEHVAVMHPQDMDWYAKNYAEALDRYTALIAG
ncbi:extracellular solute-binding protein [Rhodobacter sp. SGA-6-6]|uniref:extracellular solute-binding protein n=1 Tax=Rhodobacter sp. SGA-6-6 TaxID=2710882 RepID=UPI0013EA00CA|nr:extracellular solute-binding protein [Rhodobacter sp. SGA-6-6]NGM46080.1 extracellular solute-binding protein [Rhodobacter sp. SGA-6-6]